MSNPKVQDYAFSIIDNLLSKYPEIAYIKWDANMPIQSAGSSICRWTTRAICISTTIVDWRKH